MLRKILMALALLLIFLVGGSVHLIHRIDSKMARDSRERQRRLEPRVIVGNGRFEKSAFYTGASLGEITQIMVGWPADREGAALTVVGNEGAHFLDFRGGLKKQIRFSEDVRRPIEVAQLDASGDYGFFTRNQSWAVDAILFDKQGQERWRYHGGMLKGIDDSVVGDLDGNGKSKMVIGFNGGGGLVLLDGEGRKIWQMAESNVWHVETLDTRGDGRKEILHSNAKGQLLVRSASGEVLAHYLQGHYVCEFGLTRWGAELDARHILIPTKESGDGCCKPVLLILDAEGKTVAHLNAPLGDLMRETKGTPVRYEKGARYYAALQNGGTLERSMLFLYDSDGQIAYQEVIGDSCLGIAALPGNSGDRLLIGCTGKIWEYSPAAERRQPQVETPGNDH